MESDRGSGQRNKGAPAVPGRGMMVLWSMCAIGGGLLGIYIFAVRPLLDAGKNGGVEWPVLGVPLASTLLYSGIAPLLTLVIKPSSAKVTGNMNTATKWVMAGFLLVPAFAMGLWFFILYVSGFHSP